MYCWTDGIDKGVFCLKVAIPVPRRLKQEACHAWVEDFHGYMVDLISRKQQKNKNSRKRKIWIWENVEIKISFKRWSNGILYLCRTVCRTQALKLPMTSWQTGGCGYIATQPMIRFFKHSFYTWFIKCLSLILTQNEKTGPTALVTLLLHQ